MLFNSFEFLLFFPVVTVLFFLIPHRFRWSLLLTASCIFYMYFIPVYILILFGTIVIDYFAGILIEQASDPRKRKLFLAWSIVANVGVLAVFKYYNFFLDNINLASTWMWDEPTALRYLGIALPIGLSFHTFQAMSYTFEVYYGRQKAERNFGIYSLYVMFYPQLVAGPIERPQNVLHQFHEVKTFDYYNLTAGLRLMLWGLFKKVVIADNVAGLVNMTYGAPEEHTGLTLLFTSYFFAFQIYCDFSGYSDMAIGAARTMGYNLMENFRVPYIAGSIREFWSRWHISLSTWFRDYLYIPLGGNRVSKNRWMFNLFIVFLVSGIWHGANWTYIVWGALHGLYLIAGIIKDEILGKSNLSGLREHSLIKPLNVFITFHLAAFAWIFFRAESVGDAFLIIDKIWDTQFDLTTLKQTLGILAGSPKNLSKIIFVLILLIVFYTIDPYMDRISKGEIIIPRSWMKHAIYAALTASILLMGYFGEVSFIYFQF
jgi:alginate O-acetyltransferase complex protein AlgI